jgi:hypothetical protein
VLRLKKELLHVEKLKRENIRLIVTIYDDNRGGKGQITEVFLKGIEI